MANPSNHSRLPVAIGSSVVFHLLLAAVALWFLSAWVDPSNTDRVLVLTMRSSLLDDRAESDQVVEEATLNRSEVGTAQSAAQQPAPAREPTPPATGAPLAAPAEPAPAPATSPTDSVASQPVAEPQPQQQQVATTDSESSPVEASIVEASVSPVPVAGAETKVLTIARSSHTVAPPPAAIAEPESIPVQMTAKQQKMLNARFKRWTEEFYRIDSSADTETWQHKGQSYQARFQRLPATGDMDMEQVLIEVLTEQDGVELVTELRMKKLAFSNFAQFIHRWDPGVQVHNDELDGRFHSNSQISLAWDRRTKPTFHGKVTTASRSVKITDGNGRTRPVSRRKVFRGGIETGVRRILLPQRFAPFPHDGDFEPEQIREFEQATRITFRSDGSYSWQAADDPAGLPMFGQVGEHSVYLIGPPDAPLYLRGVVSGKVLVYSPERIVIEDDLVYAHQPGTAEAAEAGDFLGLVSDKYVDVAEPAVTGPGDLRIHASIYAKRRFNVKRYRAREFALLHIYGSLTAGSLTATEPRFATRIEFDPRLEDLRPPGFPVTDRYELADWDHTWTAKPRPQDPSS